MRLFVAVNPGERLTRALTTALDAWRPLLPLNWTAAASWHLTLQFLGDWPETRLPGLIKALAGAADMDPFTLAPLGLGTFGRPSAPRVLFLQMQGADEAALLAEKVREAVSRCWPDGPQDNKPFKGHLTVARIKRPLNGEELNLLRNMSLDELPSVEIEGFGLVVSRLERGGARHEELAFFPLRKKGE